MITDQDKLNARLERVMKSVAEFTYKTTRDLILDDVLEMLDSKHARVNDDCVCPVCRARKRIEALREVK
jgi:hypothetical protein